MSIVCSLCFQRVHRLANGDPYVVAGDFNQKPGEPGHILALTGTLPDGHKGWPERSDEKGSWELKLPQPLRSVYSEVNGKEPEVTNYAQFADKDPFAACLDYIFVSPHFSVDGVKQLLGWEQVKSAGPFPTASEPSDHVLIASDLSL
jgi:endonuclease/exonuclease/phosphatase family metal-dependent hydrolase